MTRGGSATGTATGTATSTVTGETPPGTDGWIGCGTYGLTIRDGRIVARNAKGKELASVPKELKEDDAYLQLVDALDVLDAHAEACRDTVETWMLRSLPVPAAVLIAVWADPAWRVLLENTVLISDGDGEPGLLRGADPSRGLGLVTLDGDTRWVIPTTVHLPHPILLAELDEWRDLVAGLGVQPSLGQLFRETFVRSTTTTTAEDTTVDEWEGAEFDRLAIAIQVARSGGWRVRAGAACAAVHEGGRVIEARYDLGEGDPAYETTTGSLHWVDPTGATLRLAEVGPVAWSEGMRMAATIYKQRKVDDEQA